MNFFYSQMSNNINFFRLKKENITEFKELS